MIQSNDYGDGEREGRKEGVVNLSLSLSFSLHILATAHVATRRVFDDTSLPKCFLILDEVTRKEREGEGQGGREVKNAIGRSGAEKRSKKKKRATETGHWRIPC